MGRHSKLKKFIALATAYSVLFSNTAFAVRVSGFITRHESTQVCIPYLRETVEPQCQGSPIASICQATDTLAQSAQKTSTSAALYTVTAAVCGSACFVKSPATPGLITACTITSAATTVIEGVVTSRAFRDADRYKELAKEGRKGIYASEKASERVNMLASLAMVTIATIQGAQAAQGSSQSASNTASCVTFGIATALAAWKYSNAIAMRLAAKKEAEKLRNFAGEVASSCPVPGQEDLNFIANMDSAISSGGQTTEAVGGTVNQTSQGIIKSASSGGSSSGLPTIGEMFANESENEDGGMPLDQQGLTQASAVLAQATGTSVDDITRAINEGKSPSDILAAATPQSQSMLDAINANHEQILAQSGLKNQNPYKGKNQSDMYATVGGDKSKPKTNPDDEMASMLQGILGSINGGDGAQKQGAAGPAVSKLAIRAPASARTVVDGVVQDPKQDLFDNVSRRWQWITAKFMTEDAVASGKIGSSALKVFDNRNGATSPTSSAPHSR